MASSDLVECPHCGSAEQTGLFCSNCDRYMPDATGTVRKVTYLRRFWGFPFLEFFLWLFTLIIGWFILLYFTAKTSQTPAKRILNIYLLDTESGQPIRASRVWMREVLFKPMVLSAGAVSLGLAPLVDVISIFRDRNRQAIHDQLARTIVVYAPYGLPQSLPPPRQLAPRPLP